jgi:hypothetical protein
MMSFVGVLLLLALFVGLPVLIVYRIAAMRKRNLHRNELQLRDLEARDRERREREGR